MLRGESLVRRNFSLYRRVLRPNKAFWMVLMVMVMVAAEDGMGVRSRSDHAKRVVSYKLRAGDSKLREILFRLSFNE